MLSGAGAEEEPRAVRPIAGIEVRPVVQVSKQQVGERCRVGERGFRLKGKLSSRVWMRRTGAVRGGAPAGSTG